MKEDLDNKYTSCRSEIERIRELPEEEQLEAFAKFRQENPLIRIDYAYGT